MADKQYLDETGIRELLLKLKTWIDTDKNITLKKVLYKDSSLLFFKNPNATETDTPEFKIDLPVEFFLDQTKTTFVSKFVWDTTSYPETTDPNLDGLPVLVLAIKGSDDTVSYSFINMKTLMNIYKASEEISTVVVSIDTVEDVNYISAEVNISTDSNNNLSIGSDGGLYSPIIDLSEITTQIQELKALYENLSDKITDIENSLNTNGNT